jgi:hypothetical protein
MQSDRTKQPHKDSAILLFMAVLKRTQERWVSAVMWHPMAIKWSGGIIYISNSQMFSTCSAPTCHSPLYEHNEKFYYLMPPFKLGKKLPVGNKSYHGPGQLMAFIWDIPIPAHKTQVGNHCSIWYGLCLNPVDQSERSNILIEAQERNPARNAMNVHVQDLWEIKICLYQ